MRILKSVKEFYATDEWRRLRLMLINDRGYRCERCGSLSKNVNELHGHHKEELNLENVNDVNVSLNPENVIVLCSQCHNEEHMRFTSYEKKVYIVYGSPFSGIREYCEEMAGMYDLLIDMDSIYEMITINQRYHKPQRLFPVISVVHRCLLDIVRTRNGEWINAYIMGGYQNKTIRERMKERLRAELIWIDTPKEKCIENMEKVEGIDQKFWRGIIEEYWNEFNELNDVSMDEGR